MWWSGTHFFRSSLLITPWELERRKKNSSQRMEKKGWNNCIWTERSGIAFVVMLIWPEDSVNGHALACIDIIFSFLLRECTLRIWQHWRISNAFFPNGQSLPSDHCRLYRSLFSFFFVWFINEMRQQPIALTVFIQINVRFFFIY